MSSFCEFRRNESSLVPKPSTPQYCGPIVPLIIIIIIILGVVREWGGGAKHPQVVEVHH